MLRFFNYCGVSSTPSVLLIIAYSHVVELYISEHSVNVLVILLNDVSLFLQQLFLCSAFLLLSQKFLLTLSLADKVILRTHFAKCA